ncbi:MAG TPA: GNAT family N-acetyltransferase [Mycobacteriales bacterium]|jgi:GNAT superfamily N-acetyltransferase|nr:GNAT family N-acetyltransferase [Mycobacteriales bacterium]
MEIRAVRGDDLPHLAEMYVRVYRAFDAGEQWDFGTAARLLRHYFGRHPELAFCAVEDDRPLGAFFVDVKPWWDGNRLVDGEIFVDPAEQRKGIGAALIFRVLTEAVRLYAVTVWETTTFADVEFPLSWYRRLGMEFISEWTIIGGDVGTMLRRCQLRDNAVTDV